MEQPQSLQHESPLKQENDTPESTLLSRRQAELEAANDRLQHTAQNFSLEWKTFLGYAMKIKQQRTTGVGTSSIPRENDLEDILLKTQGGLVLLRELDNRRDQQWKEVAKRYGYQHELIASNEFDKDDSESPQPQWFQTLVSKLSKLNHQVAATAHCAVKRLQLAASRDQTQGILAHQPSLLKQRAHALDTCHRLQHVLDSSSDNEPPSVITDCVLVEDVNILMQFDYMKHQQAVVLERFCIRLKWLPVSHRFHLRQRMLALAHQQKVKNTSRPNASTAYRNSKNHLQCPLFLMSTAHFAAELKVLALKYALSIPDGVDERDKSSTEEYHVLRQGADGLLASLVDNFPSDNAINTDASVEMNLETLVHSYTGNSRWEMIQHGFLGNCEPGQGRTEETLITLRNDHKIDLLLANEWELLSLEDLEYLRARLEALSRAHMNRAQVDIAVAGSVMENQHLGQEETAVDDDQSNEDSQRKSGLSSPWNPDALYSLYVLRVASCRAKRLSLLRLLNYLHFVQLSQVNSLSNTPPGGRFSKSTGGARINPWIATKCEKTGDYIVTCSPNTEEDNIDENCDKNGDQEFVFAAARRDLEVLELQMLRMASIFIFKQEYDSLPSSPRKHTNDRYGSDHDSDSVVTTIDRLEVLRDIYDCEVAFQQVKVQLVEKLLEIGLQFAPRRQDFIELGFTASETEAEPFTDILLPLLQRRPYLDFSHAYFFESYTTETILLELQTSLTQQMEQYFERLEWCALQDFAFGEQDDNDNEQQQWVCRQILGKRALIQLYSHQNELVREADEKWFSSTSIGEFHALQHALLEQTLVIWSLIIKLELPGRPVRYLERTSGDLLVGNGWQLVLPPQLLSDVCRTLHEQTNGPRDLIEYLHEAVELENWRHALGKSVYEAHLLERTHHFHFGFEKYVAAFDTVLGGEQTRHLAFFFDFGECDRTRSLLSFAMELEIAMLHTTNAASAARPTCLHSGDNKPISEWLHAQLSSSQCLAEDFGKRDDVATQQKRSENWRRSLLQLQQDYVSYLRVNVSYQDAVGADVFEFAASYPYVCLANTLVPESSDLPDEKTTVSMDFNTVRTKYAKEIADKMTEEMRTSCFPYWKKLENLKQQLQERFATTQDQTSNTMQTGFQLQDMVACGEFLKEAIDHPRLLTILNCHLQRLRNEKKLMQHLSPATRARCAFITHSVASDRRENENEDQPSALTKWLMVKLHQLKVDLHINERPKVEQLLLTPPASCSSPSTFTPRTTHLFGSNRSPLDISTSDALLQTIPSFRFLLLTFATTANYEKSSRDVSGASSAHATRLYDYREETLRILVLIFHQFNCTIDLLRIRCGSRFAITRSIALGGQQRHLPTLKNTSGSAHSGLGRLERWQSLFHREIRQLLDHLTSRLNPEAAVATGALFETHPEHLQSQHYASLMRQEICSALEEANVHSIRMMRCTSNFALLQTYQKKISLRARKRRHHLISFLSILEIITAEVMKPVPTLEDVNNELSFTARMRRLVRTGEQALFGEARSHEREREWQAFKDAINKYEPRDSAYITAVTRLLELHRVYIDENCRAVLRIAVETNLPSLAFHCAAENQALTAMEDLWERFHLPAWDSPLDEDISAKSSRVTAPIVGGENLDMKKRLLGPPDFGNSISSSSAQSYATSKDLSYALRSLQMGATTALAQFCNSGLLVLPHPTSIDEQLAYLHISVELAWVNADMKELDNHYKSFLLRRKTRRGNQQTFSVAPRKSPRFPQSSSKLTSSSTLLALSKYFHEEGTSGDQIQQPDTSSSVDSIRKSKNQGPGAAFIVPAPEMARFLHDMTAHWVEHKKQQLDLHNASIQQLHDHFQAAVLEHEKIENKWTKAKAEERIRREAFAADRTYHLYFEVEALRKQLSVMEARKELDHQVMQCDINAEYDEKLRAMHAELLNRQQKFAEYRTTMQRELQSVIQGAHTQFVDQLLDYTGSLSSTTKASVSHLLRGQQDIVRIKSENAAMKQALLKVQALGDIQQQTQNSSRERELLLTQRFSTAQALQRNEVEQLQAYIKQLEGNVSKLSEEKTYFQVKWTTAQKQMEAVTQRNREAKIRALSASHTRTTLVVDSDDDDLPAMSPNIRASPVISPSPIPILDNARDVGSVTDVNAGRPKTASTIADAGKQDHQRLETQYLNSARHYQNEIRRLQQQVTREIREKAAITEKLTQIRQYESTVSIQLRDGLPRVDDLQTPRTPLGEQTLRRDFRLPSTPRPTQSASPRASLGSNTFAAAPSPPDRTTTPKRPSSSFAPRASSLRAQVTCGSGTQPPTLVACVKVPVASAALKPSAASNTSARKFQVVKRDEVVGGVAGVSNTLSVREPLPYR